jgi:YHS domain-containing protein
MRRRLLKKIKRLILALAVALLAAGPGWTAAPTKPQTTCPVLGGNIDKKVYADYQGKRIYFCCSGCDEAFKKDPEKYMKKLKEQGVTPEDAPTGKEKK